jgi:hypothetical protein
MALCSTKRCIYITYYQKQKVRRFDLNCVFTKEWDVDSAPDGISVTPSATILVCLRVTKFIIEYDMNGNEKKRVDFHFADPRYAALLPDGRMLVCAGMACCPECGLYVVDGRSQSLVANSHAVHPLHFAVDNEYRILVADYIGNEVVMLDKMLKYAGQAISLSKVEGPPYAICYDAAIKRLYVGELVIEKARVLAFDMAK